MMGARVWQRRIPIICLLVMIWGRLFSAASAYPNQASMCPKQPLNDSTVRFLDRTCSLSSSHDYPGFISVDEGDDVSLQKALDTVNKNGHGYVAVLFYASWILSIYGVHGFPALFLINSTKTVRYRGPKTLASLVDFYTEISGIKGASLDSGSLEKLVSPQKRDDNEAKISPLTWSISREKFLRDEKYLALAAAFVLLRSIFVIIPPSMAFVRFAWVRCVQNLRVVESLLEHPRAYFNGVIHVFNSLKEPWRKRNLQEGAAINARAWASKSLATVSIGDASNSRVA